MNTIKKDKIIILLGTMLLGYYLAISLFHPVIWKYLNLFLPPINDRHLPDIHIGILGALLALFLTNLIFIRFIEKRPFKAYRKEYLISLCLLLLSPFIIGGAFRYHAVSYVHAAEKTIPTRVHIRLDSSDSDIMFETRKDSATGFTKNITVPKETLEQFGQLVNNMEPETIVQHPQSSDDTLATLWLNYRLKGKWYSKILTYNGNNFFEPVSNNNIAIYQNPELIQLFQELITQFNDLSHYTQAKIVNSQNIENDEQQVLLTDEELTHILSNIKPENKIEPTHKILERFKFLATNDFIPQTETNIYAITLKGNPGSTNNTINFMVYDKLTNTLYFNNNYYKINSTFINSLK